jgi:hypothetical protein
MNAERFEDVPIGHVFIVDPMAKDVMLHGALTAKDCAFDRLSDGRLHKNEGR